MLIPASFRGMPFHIEAGAKVSGRRNVVHEYPKRDDPYTEDMGRKARRFQISAYVIGSFYVLEREALVTALEIEGPGTLIHPTMGVMQVVVDGYSVAESREEGGLARFEIQFVEAGTTPFSPASTNTQSATSSAADTAGNSAASAANNATGTLGSGAVHQ